MKRRQWSRPTDGRKPTNTLRGLDTGKKVTPEKNNRQKKKEKGSANSSITGSHKGKGYTGVTPATQAVHHFNLAPAGAIE